MKIKSSLISTASGKLAGTVFTRGRNNAIVLRSHTARTNPRTPTQTANRQLFAQLTSAWATQLNQMQRLGWHGYASRVKRTNKLGVLAQLSGIAMFTRNNQIRMAAGLTRIDDAPGSSTIGTPADISSLEWGGFNIFGIQGQPPLPEPGENGALILRCSRPHNPGRNYFAGPFLFINTSSFEGTDINIFVSAPTYQLTPKTGTLAPGQSIFVQSQVAYEDARCSPPSTLKMTVGQIA